MNSITTLQKKQALILIVFFISALISNANPIPKKIEVKGIVKDSKKKEGLPFATVQFLNFQDSSLVKATITDFNGNYKIKINKGKYIVIASYTGYAKFSKSIEIKHSIKNLEFFLTQRKISLGEVSVTAEKKQINQTIEKTTVNIAKDKTVSGGTAIDALRNVPFVNIDMEGKVNYRGNDRVKVLINNEVSGLSQSLDQISADQIEKIEVVNNPSAKYESEGTSGIINIVLKTSKRGQNKSQFKLNMGSSETIGGNVGYSVMKNKTQFFINGGINHKTKYQTKEHFRDNYGNKDAYNYYQFDRQDGNVNGILVNTSLKQKIGKKHKLGLSLIGSKSFNDADRKIEYQTLEKSSALHQKSIKKIDIDLNNYMLEGSLNYVFKPNKKEKLCSKFHYSYFDQSLTMDNKWYPNSKENESELQNTLSKQFNNIYDYSIDYTNAINDALVLESGYKLSKKDLLNKFSSEKYNTIINIWEGEENLASNFNFDQTINALYVVLNAHKNNWKFQAGLRGEYTVTKLSQDNKEDYFELFPSVNISKKLNTKNTVFLGYSRRINRPTIKMLNPYFGEYADKFNMHKGNPDLKPEYVNMIELGNQFTIKKISGKVSVYHQHINKAITRVKSATDDSALVVSYLNLDKAEHTGAELSLSCKPLKVWGFNFSGDVFYTKLSGQYKKNLIDKDRTGWNLRLVNKFKLPYKMNLQISSYYKSKIVSALEVYNERYYVDLAINKKIFKNKAMLNFRVTDLFKTNKFRPFVNAIDDNGFWYSQTNTRKIETRYFILSLVYNIDKKQQKRKKKKGKFFLEQLVK